MKAVLHIGPINSKGGMSRTINELSDNPPDGWSSYCLESHVDGSIWSKLNTWRNSLRRMDTLVRQSEIDLIHIHTASDISWLRKKTFIRKSLKLGLPVIVSIHGGNFDKFCKRNFGIFGYGVRRLLSNPKITTVALTKRCRKLVSPWTGSSTEVIPNFISSTTNDSSVGARKAGRLLFIGRDSKEKRVNLAVEIANTLQIKGYNSTLVLAGIERNSRSIGSSVNKDYISPRGWLDSRKISELIRNSWALLITSEYEALPMTAIEAMRNGLPIIGSEAVDGIFNNAGLIVKSQDPDIWASKIGDLLEDPEKWEKMSISGPSESTIFEPLTVRGQWFDLYNSIVSGHPK